uniref:waprin-Phi1-like isoform X1 n=1 Tax=Podarcis muralis TaxID=64176 RepID=UPI0010A0BC3B|nr:waprin-Phi1-like isoform X1 [Podarcis muralis]XP_028591509.1 waprin-Phi1-like isoform X2 [Podarcis muralis]
MKARLFLVFFLMGLLTICVELPSAAGQQVRPGQCPPIKGPGTCAISCQSDESCGPGSKCCSTGCGFACKRVVEVHPGRCPRRTGPGLCAEFCTGDASCSPEQKCCSNGCGHECMTAIKG